jgi:L-ribulose-5-phosphate 3-epimerase
MSSAIMSAATLTGISNSVLPAVRTLKKGIKLGSIGLGETIMGRFQTVKDAGFDRVEVMSHLDRTKVSKARDVTRVPIPSAYGAFHLKFPLSDPDPVIREQGIAAHKVSLEVVIAYST